MPRFALKKLGLSDTEIQIYLTTLSLGQTLVSTIASKCGIKRTSTYAIIEKLVEHGFLTCFEKNNTKYYSALEPGVLVDKCKQQVSSAQLTLREIEKIVPILEHMTDNVPKVKVEFFQGMEGIKNLYIKILNSASYIDSFEDSGEMKLYIPEHVNFFIKERIERNIFNRVICPSGNPINLNSKEELRSVFNIPKEKYPFSCDIKIYDNQISIISFDKEEPMAIAITNNDIHKHFSFLFQLTWDLLSINQK